MNRRVASRLVAGILVLGIGAPAAAASGPSGQEAPGTRPVLLVGNNWDGTADILDVPSYERIKRINVIPDRDERMAELLLEPDGLGRLIVIRALIGEGHDQFADDLYTSNDGRTLYVSRPSFADVVAIDIATNDIVWRTPVFADELTDPGDDNHLGERADHMAMSPDGRHLAVSAQRLLGPADHRILILDAATGRIEKKLPSGDIPHENLYTRDGSRIFHASIGTVYTPTDEPALDATKGTRRVRVFDAKTGAKLKEWNMGEKLAEAGYPNMSSAVRPMALSPDEKWLYFQVSFFHGFVEFDLENERVTRLALLPQTEDTPKRREEYILDSAHHGIAMNGAGTKLCVAGTMSNYAAIVDRESFSHRIHNLGARTYWSTTSADGEHCYVSVAGDDTMSILSYATEREVARVPVGDHPQRARIGSVATEVFGAPPPARRARARSLSLRVRPKRDRREPYRLRLAGRLTPPRGMDTGRACNGVVRLDLRRAGAVIAHGRAALVPGKRRCRYARTLRVPPEQADGRRPVRLAANARFVGNDFVEPRRARPRTARVG